LRNSHIHDLSGVAEEQLEALVNAGSLEVVALIIDQLGEPEEWV